MTGKYGLKAKLFHSHFGYGREKTFLENSHAFFCDEKGRYEIHAPSGNIHTLRDGEFLEAKGRRLGPVEYSEQHACLFLGEFSIPIGKVTPGWKAKPVENKRRFMVQSTKGDAASFTITLGEQIRKQPGVPDECVGQTPVLDHNKNIVMGIVVKPMRKEFELNLIVMDNQEKNGYLAYFNVLEPGSKSNRRDGTRGVFYPSKGEGKPAAFCEVGQDDGQLYRTAIFWPTKNPRYSTVNYRDLEKAIMEKRLYREIEDMKKAIEDMGASPEDVGIDMDENQNRLDAINKDWNSEVFTVHVGKDFLYKEPTPTNKNKSEALSPGF